MNSNFCALILTHGRPDNVTTYHTIRRLGYTGKIYIVIDDEDKTREKYIENFGDEVLIFSKEETAKTFDEGDNFNDRRVIVYARNACFKLAEKVGCQYFIQLDDDYTRFSYMSNDETHYLQKNIYNLDSVFWSLINFYKSIPAKSIALSQSGDFMGGKNGTYAVLGVMRKAMNSFICSTDRPFIFMGRINEDVNTYTNLGRKGDLFLTILLVSLTQKETQTNSGGMTDVYFNQGTYMKSFYSVMYSPSCVKISEMGAVYRRLHHSISWKNTAVKIISEDHRKSEKV